MKKYIILLCVLVSNIPMYGSLKAGVQWAINGKKLVLLYGDENFFATHDFFKNIIKRGGGSIAFVSKFIRNKSDREDVRTENLIYSPAYSEDFSNITNFFSVFSSDTAKDLLLQTFVQNENQNKKHLLDKEILDFLQSFKEPISSLAKNFELINLQLLLHRNLSMRRDSIGTVEDLYQDIIIFLKEEIERRSKFDYDSGLLFDAISSYPTESHYVQWFKDLYNLFFYYQQYSFFTDSMVAVDDNESAFKTIIGCTNNNTVFYRCNAIIAAKKISDLKKAIFPWQIITDKDYFKNINLKKLPKITSNCALWQYKYLFDKPLSPWERLKLNALSWKKYLIPTAIVGAGLLGGAYWWNKRKAAPSSIKIKSND